MTDGESCHRERRLILTRRLKWESGDDKELCMYSGRLDRVGVKKYLPIPRPEVQIANSTRHIDDVFERNQSWP